MKFESPQVEKVVQKLDVEITDDNFSDSSIGSLTRTMRIRDYVRIQFRGRENLILTVSVVWRNLKYKMSSLSVR